MDDCGGSRKEEQEKKAQPMTLKRIAHLYNDFDSKFGVPRQSGLVEGLVGKIVFDPEYRNADALRGLEGFSHLWLLWDFSEAHRPDETWSPTVRPPRLGGNKRMGVFATRSPFRPNNIGLSSVKILRIELSTAEGPVIWVEGADLMNGTPLWDIKPYLPFTDSHPDARGGFTEETRVQKPLEVVFPEGYEGQFTDQQFVALQQVLAQDPRPHYIHDPERIYGLSFAGREVHFRVEGETLFVLP